MAAGYFGSSNPNSPAHLGGDSVHRLDDRRRRRSWSRSTWARWSRRTISQWRIARRRSIPRLAVCAAVILAANLGPAMMIISFTPFVTQIGIQYWFLAGALHGVACRYGVQRDA